MSIIGKSASRLEGEAKVTGRAIYTVDVELPGMACGRILRSPYPHARLIEIDARKARALPGVLAVLTREELSEFNPYYGAAYRDQPIVALDKVRYAGDPVAAVAAVDESTAEEALALIELEYEELPAVMTVEEALAPDAPLVHEEAFEQGELQGFQYRAPDEFKGTNICYRFSFKKGDASEGFRQADYIFEDTFTLPAVHHYSMEAHSTVAQFDGERLALWASTQDPFILQNHLAEIFRLPANRIRIIVPYLGGGYGGKLSVKTEPLAVALSWKARRPVKIVHSVEESFKTITRHGARCRIKTGVAHDGRLMARECEIYMDTGAYADAGPRVTQKAGYRAPGPYRIPHMRTDAYTVYTNSVPAGAFRGFGTPQVSWAYESQMDIIAARLGLDPLELRLKNLLDKGEDFTPGDRPVDCDLREGLRRVAEAIGWHLPAGKPNSGKGLSCSMRDGGGAYKLASAAVKMNTDGSVVLFTGTVEMGQGAHTALSQIVAEELSAPLERVVVAQLDTDVTPYDAGTNASSSTVVMGLCVQRAARDLKRQLLARAAKKLKGRVENLTLREGKIHAGEGPGISFEEILTRWFGSRGGEIVGRGFYQDKKSKKAVLGFPTIFWEVSWGAAEIEIDPETGAIKILKYVSATDAGKAIHPVQCSGQDEGAVMTAIGHTLFEEMVYKDGALVNPNLVDYRLPYFNDLPKTFDSILIENQNGPGPYGAKGISEGGLLPVAPAISNALYRAAGVRIRDLPLTPEKVWRALKEKKAEGGRR